MSANPRIGHSLWFDHQAEEAARFYTALFEDGRILRTVRYTDEGFEIHGGRAGTVMSVEFEIAGQRYVAINGGPLFRFNEAFSIVVYCDSQQEIDRYWSRLLEGGGQESHCGWLKDRFGVSWQVTPRALGDMLGSPDQDRVRRVTRAFLQMRKFDLAALRKAFDGA